MIGEIWKVAKTVVQLADDLQKYHAEIKEIRQDILKITLQLQRMSDEIELLKQREADEREKIELRLRIWQLEFEKKQLPPAREDGEP
jgi:chromosome segregation ATPase